MMTMIERLVWTEIKCHGLPMYPQFPAMGYFLDFADPIKKIAIEADGKRWHKDKEKDARRDFVLESAGWEIYRIQGKDTFFDPSNQPVDEFDDYDYEPDPLTEHLKIIKENHYKQED